MVRDKLYSTILVLRRVSIKNRKKMENPNEESKKNELNDFLVQLGVLNENDRKIECFFIDNT